MLVSRKIKAFSLYFEGITARVSKLIVCRMVRTFVETCRDERARPSQDSNNVEWLSAQRGEQCLRV